MLLKYEILKIVRSRLWKLLFSLLLLIQGILILLQPFISSNPQMQFRELNTRFLEPLEDLSVSEKRDRLCTLSERFTNASRLRSFQILSQYGEEDPDLSPEQMEDAARLLESAGDSFQDQKVLVHSLAETYTRLDDYGEYLDSIHSAVEEIRKTPVWRTWSESRIAEMEQTVSRYDQLRDIDGKLSDSGLLFSEAFCEPASFLLFAAMVLLTAAISLSVDSNSDMDFLIRSSRKGNRAGTAAKLCACTVVMSIQLLCAGLVQYGLSGLLYGFPGPGAPLQSLPLFYHSPLHWDILQWLIWLTGEMLVSGVLMIALCFFLWKLFASKAVWILIILLTGGLLLQINIPQQSVFYPLAWFNLYALLNPLLYCQNRTVFSGIDAEVWLLFLQLLLIAGSVMGVFILSGSGPMSRFRIIRIEKL